MQRRTFLQQAISSAGIASPLISPSWKPSAPRAYIAELGRLMRAAPVPGAVIAVVENHKLVWVAPLGVLTEGSPAPVTESSLFEAASLTKPLVGYAAFTLRAAGKLDFDRPLVGYLDDLPNALARTVTARHVLSHTSGFVNWRNTEPGKPGEPLTLPDLAPSFQPGTKFQYSGEGIFYLQRVLEKIHGNGIEQTLQDLVMQPLGMTSSTLIWDPATLSRTSSPHDNHGEVRHNWDKPARSLRNYAAKIGKPVAALVYEDYATVAREAGSPVLPGWLSPNAAGDLITSAQDYARFVIGMFRYADEIRRPQIEINEFIGWGLGWGIERTEGKTYLWHSGDNGAFKNFVMAEPDTGDAVIVFTNGASGARVYDRAITHATGRDHPALFWW